MNYKEKLWQAVDYAIETHYAIHQRATDIWNDIYAHKNICIFGTGEFFNDCSSPEFISRFEYVGDNNPERWGKYFKGRKCLSPDEIVQMEDIVVLIMIGEWRPVYEQMKQLGVTCYPLEWCALTYDVHYSDEWFEENRDVIINTVDLFEDEISKEIYTEVMLNRIAPAYATKTFNELKISGEYFDTDVFRVSEEEYLVDAGAYKGDSIEKMLKITNGKFGAIYSFELDSEIFKELKKTAEKYDISKIQLINAGVSDKSDTILYNYVQGREKKEEKIVTIDEMLLGKKVTLIKMDVETYELKALEGARHIIQSQKPKLAISAYHYLSDLWNIPIKIKELCPEYKLKLRHHSPAVWDTDCYAIIE